MLSKLFCRRAFTLLETIIVIAVIGILTAFSIPIFLDQTENRRVATDVLFEQTARQAYSSQYDEEGALPASGNRVYYNPDNGKWVADASGITGYGQCRHNGTHDGMILTGTPVQNGYTYDVDVSWVGEGGTGALVTELCSGMTPPTTATPVPSAVMTPVASFAPEPSRTAATPIRTNVPEPSPSYRPLPVPGGLKFDEVGDGLIKISWDACHSAVTNNPRYQIHWKNEATGATGEVYEPSLTDSSSTEILTTHTFEGLTNGQKYTFKVRVVNDRIIAGVAPGYIDSVYSSTISETPIEPPTKPLNVKSNNSVNSEIKISWDTVLGVAEYEAEYKLSTGSLWTVFYDGDDTEAIKKELISPKWYNFRVRSYKTWGSFKIYSPYSDVVNCQTVARGSGTMYIRVHGATGSIFDINQPVAIEYKSIGTDNTYKDIVANYRWHSKVECFKGDYMLGYSHDDYHTWGIISDDFYTVDVSAVSNVIGDPDNVAVGGIRLKELPFANYDYSGAAPNPDCMQRLYINRGGANRMKNYRGIGASDAVVKAGNIFTERYHIVGYTCVDPVYKNFYHGEH